MPTLIVFVVSSVLFGILCAAAGLPPMLAMAGGVIVVVIVRP